MVEEENGSRVVIRRYDFGTPITLADGFVIGFTVVVWRQPLGDVDIHDDDDDDDGYFRYDGDGDVIVDASDDESGSDERNVRHGRESVLDEDETSESSDDVTEPYGWEWMLWR